MPAPEAPRIWLITNGIVKTPNRFEVTVSSRARALLPPTVCKGMRQLAQRLLTSSAAS